MRHKKHLNERMQGTADLFLARETYDFYQTPPAERNFVVDLAQIFGNNNPVTLEIGCGKGSYAITCAKQHPERNFIAVEKLSNVIVVGAEQAQKENLSNLRFLNCSAENLLYFLPHHCVQQIVLNFSCPYPKKGYTRRRLTHSAFLEKYKLLLTEQGTIHQKTDDEAFFDFSLEQFAQCGFELLFCTRDLHSQQVENIVTEYEAKFLEMGKKICACVAQLK